MQPDTTSLTRRWLPRIASLGVILPFATLGVALALDEDLPSGPATFALLTAMGTSVLGAVVVWLQPRLGGAILLASALVLFVATSVNWWAFQADTYAPPALLLLLWWGIYCGPPLLAGSVAWICARADVSSDGVARQA
ncbi:MAG TPA: hypothetical protein VH393_09155 [Ktedonobacterales bacterium]|jgi:hypothetical protein